MNKLVVRTCERDELEGLYEMFIEIYNTPQHQQGFLLLKIDKKEFMKNLDVILVAKINDESVGFLILKNRIPEGRASGINITESRGYISDLIVPYKYSGMGIGTALITEVCKHMSVYSCIVVKPFMNEASLRLHKKMGFEEVGKMNVDNKIEGYEVVILEYSNQKIDGKDKTEFRQLKDYTNVGAYQVVNYLNKIPLDPEYINVSLRPDNTIQHIEVSVNKNKEILNELLSNSMDDLSNKKLYGHSESEGWVSLLGLIMTARALFGEYIFLSFNQELKKFEWCSNH